MQRIVFSKMQFSIPNKVIDDLNERLAKKRELVEPLEGAAWTYGFSTTYLKDVIEYWRTQYNWTERMALLNKYPQFVTNIQGNISSVLDSRFLGRTFPRNFSRNNYENRSGEMRGILLLFEAYCFFVYY